MVIAFIVEAFVLQLEQTNLMKEKMKKKILERHITVVDDTDCVEGIYIHIQVEPDIYACRGGARHASNPWTVLLQTFYFPSPRSTHNLSGTPPPLKESRNRSEWSNPKLSVGNCPKQKVGYMYIPQ